MREDEAGARALKPEIQVSVATLVQERLERDPPASGMQRDLILASLGGPIELAAVLEGGAASTAAPDKGATSADQYRGVFLREIAVSGFRGIGDRAALEFSPTPGLTLVVGRNGSGKSSFAEGLEMLLTGENYRWKGKVKVWQDGWRNLHQGAAALDAGFVVEGRPTGLQLRLNWGEGTALDQAAFGITGQQGRGRDTLGWNSALVNYRPFLSYNELGDILEQGQASLYDAIARILGVEELTTAEKLLGDVRRQYEKSYAQAVDELPGLLAVVDTCDDPRAHAVAAALSGRGWELSAVERVLKGKVVAPPATDRALLNNLSKVSAPDWETVLERDSALTRAIEQTRAAAGTDSQRARRLATLLRQALELHAAHPDQTDCPVCGGTSALTDAWRAATEAEVQSLLAAAQEADEYERVLDRALKDAVALLAPAPRILSEAAKVGLDATALLQVWKAWCEPDIGSDPGRFSEHLHDAYPPLATAVKDFRALVETELQRREDLWSPVAQAVAAWLPLAAAGEKAKAQVSTLKAASAWLKEATDDIRARRFAPISNRAEKVWQILRHDSNVSLQALKLSGTGNSRKLELDVAIDGSPGSALGVMSQGELHCLALALFLPRATLEESPFRFVVIDDPIQAMDPNKVDAMARLLAEVAADHQVIVFTHDERLPESVRRLQIPATTLEISRRANSVVETRQVSDPVRRHLEDARAVANTNNLPVKAGQVVPSFCRLALETAAAEAYRRRRLARGETHVEVEEVLAKAMKLKDLMGLALFDAAGRAGDVMGALQNNLGSLSVDTLKRCEKGVHVGEGGDLPTLISEVERIVQHIETRGRTS